MRWGVESLQKGKVQFDTWTETAVMETGNPSTLTDKQGQQQENIVRF